MIQPIAVLKDASSPETLATHEETCLAAALASTAALAACGEDPLWAAWYPHGQGKSVRRGKPKDLRALEAEGAVTVHVGNAVAAAFAPREYPLTGRMRQLQVAGTELEHTSRPVEHAWPAPPGVPSLQIALDTSLGMSTGKAAAQAAHAAFDWAVGLGEEGFAAWIEAGQPSRLVPATRQELRELLPSATVEIHDAGHTEIASGSLTALAR